MAKHIITVRRLILNAGKATPAYPVGPILGTYSINLGIFVKEALPPTQEREQR